MIVPDEIRNSVVFLEMRNPDGSYYVLGTGVLTGRRIDDDLWFKYLVTARHVIDAIRDGGFDVVCVRMNLKSGSSIRVDVSLSEWFFHPDGAVDLAMAGFEIPEDAEHLYYPLIPHSYLTQEFIAEHQVGPGDEIFMAGLFWPHAGTQRMLPVIRVGNIAAMPEEKVYTECGYTDAFLVESRSIGGLSGSPVFLHLGLVRQIGGEVHFARDTSLRGGHIALMGIMHGHFPVDNLSSDVVGAKEIETINAGIAVVVPVWKIFEAIDQPTIKANESAQVKRARRRKAPVPDALLSQEGQRSR